MKIGQTSHDGFVSLLVYFFIERNIIWLQFKYASVMFCSFLWLCFYPCSSVESANDILHPGQRRGTGAIEGRRTLRSRANDVIEGPETQVENSESENDD